MLLIARFPGNILARFEFGQPLQPETTPEERVRAILTDYRRRDELIDVGFYPAVEIVVSILDQAGHRSEDILFPICALGFLGIPDGAQAVAKHVSHPEPAIRLAAIRSLGCMTKFDSIPLVLPFLDSPLFPERREAIIALGKFTKEDVLPAVDAAAGAGPALQLLAQQARARIHAFNHGVQSNDFQPLVDALIGTDEFEDLLPIFMVSSDPLKTVLRTPARSAQDRERALRLFIIVRPREIVNDFRRILFDPAEPLPIRLRAVYGLGRARSRASIPDIVERLQSPEPGMTAFCIQALGQIGDPTALDPLLDLWDSHPELRAPLRAAIRQLCPEPPSPLPPSRPEFFAITDGLVLLRQFRRDQIEPALLSPSAAARRDAFSVLSLFGAPADAHLLSRAAETDPDPANREAAALGAARLGGAP